jgi:hypothetical protein
MKKQGKRLVPKRESLSLRRFITQKQEKLSVPKKRKKRESLSAQVHKIKIRKMVGAKKERLALCAGA